MHSDTIQWKYVIRIIVPNSIVNDETNLQKYTNQFGIDTRAIQWRNCQILNKIS